MKTKKTIIQYAILGLFILKSCAIWYWPDEKRYENVYNGMTISEFKTKHPKALNESIENGRTVFSITYCDTETKFPRSVEDAKYKKFYYFENGKLVKVDKGVREVDYRLEID